MIKKYYILEPYLDRAIQYCFYLFIVSSLVSISIAQISFTVASVVWAYKLYLQKECRPIEKPLWIAFALFTLFSLLSVFISIDFFVSLVYAKKLLMIIIFFLFLNNIHSQKEANFLVVILIVTEIVLSFYGFFQAYQHGISLSTRVAGTMSIYMTFAGLAMLVNIMVFSKLIFDFHWKKDWWVTIAVFFISVSLLLTLTKNAWLGTVAGITVLFFLKSKKWILCTPLLVGFFFFISPQVVQQRMQNMFDPSFKSNKERIYMMHTGIKIVKDYPLLGCGLDCVKLMDSYKMEGSERRLDHLHNNIFQTAAQGGLLGLGSWLSIWVLFFCKSFQIVRRLDSQNKQGRYLVTGSIAAVCGFHVAGLFECNFYDSEVTMLLYFLMCLPFVVDKYGDSLLCES